MPASPGHCRRFAVVTAAVALPLLAAALPLAADATTFRYVRSENAIYIENGGVATLGAIHAALPDAPLGRVATRTWLLGADIVIANGSALRLHGHRAGGDVDELRLKSANSHKPGSVVSITADYGHIDIRATKITSWDPALEQPDHEYATYGRAFIRARSRLRTMVLNPLQSRMDIVDSEIAYLGYNANESYGLVWKVVAPEAYVFDHVRVFGDVLRSRIHHNYFGIYTSGAKGSVWRGNEVHDNVQYGLAPHNRSDDLRIEDNDVHHNGHHGLTVRQHCARAMIRNNRIWANGESGLWLHRHSNEAVVADNRVFMNRDGGITLHSSARIVVRDNVVLDNGHVGVQLVMGTSDSRVEDNEIGDNGFYGVFVGKGKGRPPWGDGLPRRNRVSGNVIYGSAAEELRTGDAGLNHYAGNTLLTYETEDVAEGEEPGLFTNPPRGAAARLASDLAPAGTPEPPDEEESDEPRRPGLLARFWPMPQPVLWAGAIALVVTLLLMNGTGPRARSR